MAQVKAFMLIVCLFVKVMEKKDEMEEKMLGTFEVKTKAVTCHICNYTAFKVSIVFCFIDLI